MLFRPRYTPNIMENKSNNNSMATVVSVVVAITVTHGVASRMLSQGFWLSLLIGAAVAFVAAGLAYWIVQRFKKP
jgi:hypothetical protein